MRGTIRKNIKKILTVLLTLAMISVCMVPSFAAVQLDKLFPTQGRPNSRGNYKVATAGKSASAQREEPQQQTQTQTQTDNQTAPQSETMQVMVSGVYDNIDRNAIVNRINAIRKEAYDANLVSSYVPVKWSSDMEAIARQRAAEGVICAGHYRPDGSVWYSADSRGIMPDGEDMDWDKSSVDASINYWYSGKSDFESGQNTDAASLYMILINPAFQSIGFSRFSVVEGTVKPCSVLEVSKESNLPSGAAGSAGTASVDVNVLRSNLSYHFDGPSNVSVGNRVRYEVVGNYATTNDPHPSEDESNSPYTGSFTVSLKQKPTWTSTNESVATISQNGVLTANARGTTTVIAQINGRTVGKQVTVS